MALKNAIFDATVFNYFLKITAVDLEPIVRSLISEKVLIPSQVVSEIEVLMHLEPKFKAKINRWIDLSHRRSFYHYCDTYDSIVLALIREKLDEGEAGAIAQAEKTKVVWFISDDYKNSEFIWENYRNIRLHSTFFLIALADISGLLKDYEKVIVDFLRVMKYEKFKKSKKKNLKTLIRSDYIEALKLKGLRLDKRLVSKRTSIDTIFKNAGF